MKIKSSDKNIEVNVVERRAIERKCEISKQNDKNERRIKEKSKMGALKSSENRQKAYHR